MYNRDIVIYLFKVLIVVDVLDLKFKCRWYNLNLFFKIIYYRSLFDLGRVKM